MLRTTLLALALATPALAAPTQLVVASYNIRSGAGTWNLKIGPWKLPHVPWNRTKHLDRIADTLREAGADMVGLQEVQGKNLRSGLIDQPKYLGRELEMEHERLGMSTTLGGAIDRTGIAVLSRYPILETREKRLDSPDQDSSERAVQLVRVAHPAFPGGLWLGNTHMQGGAANPMQMARIRDLLAEVDGPVILTGDFNVGPDSEGVQAMLDWQDGPHRFRDAVAEAGVGNVPSTPNGSRRIDHVLVSGPFRARAAEVRTEAAGESDHYPVIVTLEVVPEDRPVVPVAGPSDLFGLGAVE